MKSELKDNLDLRFFNEFDKSFHPKSYIIHTDDDSAIFIGSSNLSKGAFTDSIEWNYQFKKSDNEEDFTRFYNEFELLFNKKSIEVTDEVLKYYSKHWVKPKLPVEPVKVGFKPRGPQIEALYELENTREEGYGKREQHLRVPKQEPALAANTLLHQGIVLEMDEPVRRTV